MDHAVNMASTEHSAKHILVISCEWSSYVHLFACRTTSALEAAKHLNLLIRRHGIPNYCSSDRGGSFISQVMMALKNVYKFEYTHHVGYAAQSTGNAESHVARTKKQIKFAKLLNPTVDIFSILSDVAYSLNTSVMVATGLTPHYMFHGWDVKHPSDIDLKEVLTGPTAVFAESI